MKSPICAVLGTSLLCACTAVLSAPTIDKVVINPPPVDGWIIAPATGGKNMPNVMFQLEGTDLDAACTNLIAGWKVNGACATAATIFRPPWPKWVGLSSSNVNVACGGPPRLPLTTIVENLNFEVTNRAKGAIWSPCISNTATNQSASQDFRVSFGQPVKSVKVDKATFSESKRILTINGTVTPKADTKLSGSIAHVLDGTGIEISTATVVGKKIKTQMDVPLDNSSPIEFVSLRVVNTASKAVRVKTVP